MISTQAVCFVEGIRRRTTKALRRMQEEDWQSVHRRKGKARRGLTPEFFNRMQDRKPTFTTFYEIAGNIFDHRHHHHSLNPERARMEDAQRIFGIVYRQRLAALSLPQDDFDEFRLNLLDECGLADLQLLARLCYADAVLATLENAGLETYLH